MTFCTQTIVDNSSRIALDRTSFNLKLPEIEYLLLNPTALYNQLARYWLAEPDVTEYVHSAAGTTAFVPPKDSACLFVQYVILFDKINGNL
jgi:hypothetical protein